MTAMMQGTHFVTGENYAGDADVALSSRVVPGLRRIW
jgi:hypothetical protein